MTGHGDQDNYDISNVDGKSANLFSRRSYHRHPHPRMPSPVEIRANYSMSGFNLPMSITPSAESCQAPSCKANINEVCPDVLRGGLDDNGANMMCMSSCKAEFGDTPAGNRACCDGEYLYLPIPPCHVD